MTAPAASPFKRMKLRYAGTCRGCGRALPAGRTAVYYRQVKQVECTDCFEQLTASVTVTDLERGGAAVVAASASDPVINSPLPDPVTERAADPAPASTSIEAGIAGASARREHERRVAKREQRIRSAHPRIGGFLLAVTDEPQSTRAWERGAIGEETLACTLNAFTARGARVLHDRRIPGTRANIDHILIAPAGVFVIDAKRYKGRPHLRVEGGILRPRTETLIVGRRDCTKLITGIHTQVDIVTTALAYAGSAAQPVRGMLCFIDADWPLIGGSFSTANVDILWPKKIADNIFTTATLDAEQIAGLHSDLAAHFPPA